ncbi:hypothetical protein GCM10010430_73450 [Kitasatospora cystarginea]|uniref:DUF1540 domain-containing protein n=1 Tax=Kitasatospora cystarginea TaxID=58350 RepID=A0ABN3EY14_9ACTN
MSPQMCNPAAELIVCVWREAPTCTAWRVVGCGTTEVSVPFPFRDTAAVVGRCPERESAAIPLNEENG